MSKAETESAGRRPVGRENIVRREGLEVLRLAVPAGGAVPEHHASTDVVVVVVGGSGAFTVAGEPRRVAPGDVVDMTPNVRHAIAAEEDSHARRDQSADPHGVNAGARAVRPAQHESR